MMRNGIVLMLAGFLCGYLAAFEVQVAEFQSIEDSDKVISFDAAAFNKNFFTNLILRDSNGLIGFKYRDMNYTNGIVVSQTDAVKNCEINGWEILVYGHVIARNYGFDVEIRIYSHPERRIIRTILLRSTVEDGESLVIDGANKVYAFFSHLLKIDPEDKPFVAEGDSFVTSHTIQWWGTIPPWIDTVTSIAGYHGNFGFRLGTPLWTNGEWAWIQELGLDWGFHYGMNNPSVIDSSYYDIDLGINLTLALVWQRQREFRVSLEPGIKIHLLHYIPMYDESRLEAWVWYGAQFDLEYRFWLNSRRTFGIGLRGGVAAYLTEPFYLDYRAGVNFAWKGLFK